MRIAAIDVGTTSIHTIIAEVHGDGTFQVIDQQKEMVRLGEEETEDGLTSRAIADGLQALTHAREYCDQHHAEHIVAVATSAVREARNGGSFLELIRKQTGIQVEAIPPSEQSRLIYLSVRDSVPFGERRVLIVNVGGGCVEFIVGDRRNLHFDDSVKVGVSRLFDRYRVSDPVQPEEIDSIRRFLQGRLKNVLRQVCDSGFDWVIGTSGTSLTLLRLAKQREGKRESEETDIDDEFVSAKSLQSTCNWTLRSRGSDFGTIDGMDSGRRPTIVMGAVLWQYLLQELRVDRVLGCERGLREGVVIDYLDRHLRHVRHRERYPEPRRRSVMGLAQRCNWASAHSHQVTSHALSIFDQLRPLHKLGTSDRELLEYASILHDIGYHVSERGHHRHGHYLIMNADLLGFTREEIRMVAAVVRYHRKRTPRKADQELLQLTSRQRRSVEVLAGILRIAEALDRTHFGVVQKIRVRMNDGTIELKLHTRADAELEVWFAKQRASLLEQALGKTIRLRVDKKKSSQDQEELSEHVGTHGEA